jgi:hypothetical protein
MNKITKIGLGILLLAIVFTAGRFSKPAKVETKEVVKTVTVKEEGKTKIVYRDRETRPDGTVIEKEVEREDSYSRDSSEYNRSTDKKVTNDSGLTLSALAVVKIDDIKGDRDYAAVVSKRILGGLNVSAMATTDKKIGVGLGWSF